MLELVIARMTPLWAGSMAVVSLSIVVALSRLGLDLSLPLALLPLPVLSIAPRPYSASVLDTSLSAFL